MNVVLLCVAKCALKLFWLLLITCLCDHRDIIKGFYGDFFGVFFHFLAVFNMVSSFV